MKRIFCLRYALVSLLLITILGIAGSPIFCSERANAAEEKQLSKTKKQAKYLRYERKKNARLKVAKKVGKPGKFSPFYPICDWFDEC
jgi:hypothetical protein